MRLVLQRVTRARVTVDGEEVGAIGRGVLALVGVERGDGPAAAAAAARKLAGLRLFDDEDGRMNLSTAEVGGAFLVVSQFTLAGSLERGRRPSFDGAAAPADAEPLVEALVAALRGEGLPVATGRFRARMAVELVNDGPVTFVLEVRGGPESPAAAPA
ncbi:MAG TPA: D-aminoacyl-tRNA deacylase [Thermoanaerobaculia bacterium]|jgi:D-tyrosyl-tRNA(Tyr) deacylase|nr:D-aminoacyl-tRNA deacylase [Thermoanaerobaculia bacterium]